MLFLLILSITTINTNIITVTHSSRRARQSISLAGAVEELCVVEDATMSCVVLIHGHAGLEIEVLRHPHQSASSESAYLCTGVVAHAECLSTLRAIVVVLLEIDRIHVHLHCSRWRSNGCSSDTSIYYRHGWSS